MRRLLRGKHRFALLGLSALVALTASLLAAAASADDISNNIDPTVDAVAEIMPLTQGGTNGTTQLYVLTRNGDGKNGCNLTGSTTLNISLTSSNPSVATVSPSQITFGSCDDKPTVTVTPHNQGEATITASLISNNTGGTFNLAPVRFTVKVAPPPNTPPQVSVTGVTGGAFYAKGSVPAATCQVTDAEDGDSSFPATLSAVGGPYASDGIGRQTASCSYTDAGGLTAVASETYEIVDHSPPSISYTLAPASPDGDNGWYRSDVSLTWDVKEPDSPSSLEKTGCVDQNITSDQPATTYSCSASSVGGSAGPQEITIKRDASAPSLDCETGPSGWQANNVLLGCTAADVGPSGLANSGDASFQLSTNVAAGSETSAAQTGSKTVKDSAGNTATIGPFTFMVDRKAPTVSCDSPASSFLLNQSPANVTGTAADGGSGPASQILSKPVDTSSVGGGKTVTLTAADAVGNEGSATCSYSVGYKFEGFSAPVDNNGTLNAAKAGQAIPLKWRLLDANSNPVTSLSSVKVTVTSLACSLGTTQDALEEYAAGSSGLQNLGNGYYQFNWKSPGTYANSCKTLNLDLGEGSPRAALFRFTK